MFPFNFEWIWDAGHMVFHGGLWYALSIIGLGVTYCVIKAAVDTAHGKEFDVSDKVRVFKSWSTGVSD
jgi:hypothetical protein